jgi:DNA (cytosine-5)-methyltransferase 1
MAKTRPTVIELFCGAGGTSFGFQRAGFDVRLGLDIDEQAIATFRLNHPSAVALHESVEEVTGRELLHAAELEVVDVLVGGPSCQGYSTIGPRLEDDPRNFLFTHYLRLVSELRPRWIVFENVKGMKFHGGGKFFSQLCRELGALGYRIASDVLNAADYGVPQRRERLIVIGTRDDCGVTLPPPSHEDPRCATCSRPDRSNRVRDRIRDDLFADERCPRCHGTGREIRENLTLSPWVSVSDAIGDLPTLGEDGGTMGFTPYSRPPNSDYQERMREGSTGYTLHKARPVSKFARSIVELVPEGKGIRSVPVERLPERFKVMRTISSGALRQDCTTLYYRLARDLPAYTITCSFTNVASGAFVHPLANRALTIREASRLQSFPDRFKFSDSGLKDQIGNAVPPILAEAIAKEIRKELTGRERSKRASPKCRTGRAELPATSPSPGPEWRQGSLGLP